MEIAVKAVLDVKEEKRRAKEERRAKKRAEKEMSEVTEEVATMDVDGDDKKDKKRKRGESAAADADSEAEDAKVSSSDVLIIFTSAYGNLTGRGDRGRAKGKEEGEEGSESWS